MKNSRDTKIVVFLGMDGSGKSTLSKYLYEELKKRGYNVTHKWWLECENSILRKVFRKLWKREDSKDGYSSNSKLNKSNFLIFKIFRILWPKVVLLDYLRFGIFKASFPKMLKAYDIMIFDRYFYDVIFSIAKEFDFAAYKQAIWFRIYRKFLPEPDIIFFIDVSPEVAYMRKKEEICSIENARTIWKTYQELYLTITKMTSAKKIIKINNIHDINIIKKEILKKTLKLLEED